MTKRNRTIAKLRAGKAEREAFVASQISVGIPFQVRALRAQRGWDQTTLAQKVGMAQPRVSAIEKVGGASLNLETLKRLAAAFDIGLVVRFAPFSELVTWSSCFSPDDFKVVSFGEDDFNVKVIADTNLPNTSIVPCDGVAAPLLRIVVNNLGPTVTRAPDGRTTAGICPVSDSAFGIQQYGT